MGKKNKVNIDNIKMEDAVISLPANAIQVTFDADMCEGGKIIKVKGKYDLEAIRKAFELFEDTVAGEYPVYDLTDKGRELL